MKKTLKKILFLISALSLLIPTAAYAREGDCGYEGGISAEQFVPKATAGKSTFDYQELCFISGEPVVFKGTLNVTKSLKQDVITSTYAYTLKNTDKSATLTRSLSFDTKLTKKDNGQTVEETAFNKAPTESIKIGSSTYTLKSYVYTRSNLVDAKPAINYFAGNTRGTKVYQASGGTGTSANTATITVDMTGSFYGYDQYWGTTEVETFNYVIQSEKKNGDKMEKWGGTADVTLSSNNIKQLRYVKNEPDQISFDGGYVQTRSSSSIMEYSSRLPEFDSKNTPTDNMIEIKNSLKLEAFPTETRLPVPDLNHLRGHWSENDVKALYSLEVFKGGDMTFDPDRFMTRAEFTVAIARAAREVPPDPSLASKTTAASGAANKNKKQQLVSPFSDVSTENTYFSEIDNAFKRGLLSGKGGSSFAPDDNLTLADALTVFVRALGLENLAPGTGAVTNFRDNDQIPMYARNAAFVAERIGLIKGDEKGYLNPGQNLTKARAAALISRFVNYMRDGIRNDYRERAVNY